MSSILKALKKLEDEKSVSKPGQLPIDARILQDRSPKGIPRAVVGLIIIIVLAGGSSSTYLLMKQKQPEKTVASQMTPASLEKQSNVSVSPVIENEKKNINYTNQKPALQTTKTNAKVENASRPVHSNTVSTKIPIETPQASKPADTVRVDETPHSWPVNTVIRPVLTVNGIAFQEGSGDNLAVINGTTVSRGSIIEGAKVEEIQSDRVRFSQNGERFEIILNKTNR